MVGGQLRFDTLIRNYGAHAFEVVGTPDERNQKLVAQRCVGWADPAVVNGSRVCLRHEPIGELVWHRDHNHLHVDGLARYRLYEDTGGSPGELLKESPKVGFCLIDSYPLRRHEFPADVHPLADPLLEDRYDLHRSQAEQWYVECRFLYGTGVPWPGLRMGISAGWQDLYNAPVPGQQFHIAGLPDGTYWIQTLVNASPVVRVLETDTSDNEHWTSACLLTRPDGARDARPGPC